MINSKLNLLLGRWEEMQEESIFGSDVLLEEPEGFWEEDWIPEDPPGWWEEEYDDAEATQGLLWSLEAL